MCASIYGCQGFELDYAGVIWGRDFVIRNGQWAVGPASACKDNVGKPSLARLVDPRHARHEEALGLLVNRYRIFLTRGIQGTVVHCEDPETGDFLKSAVA